jgi:hypothetical protein
LEGTSYPNYQGLKEGRIFAGFAAFTPVGPNVTGLAAGRTPSSLLLGFSAAGPAGIGAFSVARRDGGELLAGAASREDRSSHRFACRLGVLLRLRHCAAKEYCRRAV